MENIYQMYNTKSQSIRTLNEKEKDRAVRFYKLKHKVWNSEMQEYSDTLTNARKDIFLWQVGQIQCKNT